MVYTIIEDCSPYYIRFKYDGLDELISFIANQPIKQEDILNCIRDGNNYQHYNYNAEVSQQILDKLPMSKDIDFNVKRVAVFTTPPGGKCFAHKDGTAHRVSFNIPIQILDN